MIKKPDWIVSSIAETGFFEHLAVLGFRNILSDVDNTLAARGEKVARPEFIAAIKLARDRGLIDKLFLVSNTIWDPRGDRAHRVASISHSVGADGFYCANMFHKKPNEMPFQIGLTATGSKIRQTAYIGDQLYTDIAGAKEVGLYAVLVNPLSRDNFFTCYNRERQNRQLRKWSQEPSMAL